MHETSNQLQITADIGSLAGKQSAGWISTCELTRWQLTHDQLNHDYPNAKSHIIIMLRMWHSFVTDSRRSFAWWDIGFMSQNMAHHPSTALLQTCT